MIRQVKLDEWPSGLEQDVLHLSLRPAEIARRSGVQFETGVDSLDIYEAAVVNLGNGRNFALQYYPNAPVPGTTLILDQHSASGFKDALKLLGVHRHDVIWVAPHLKPALWTALRERVRKGFIHSQRAVLPKTRARPKANRRSAGWKQARLQA